MSTLRIDRRQRTTKAIRKAAVDLACEHGLDAVTVEMISAVAGISPRTFFNYFPFREAAFTPPDLDFPEALVARFVAGRGRLVDDVLVLMAPILEALGDDSDTLVKCHKLSLEAPKLAALHNSVYARFDDAIRNALAGRLKSAPDDPATCHLAALLTATIKCGIAMWVISGKGTATSNLRERLDAVTDIAQAFSR